MRFVWFWAFWHWSKESFRAGMLLRRPLEGIASNWDEWFQHEASAAEREAIEGVGRSADAQRQFLDWLLNTWAAEAVPGGNRLVTDIVVRELARVAPFDRWIAFAEYRSPRDVRGISAIVLADKSAGRATDVRPVEAVVLPVDPLAPAGPIIADDFHADVADLNAVQQAAIALVGGAGRRRLLARWIATGRRPYPCWLNVTLSAGWLGVAGLIAWLLFGPEPGVHLSIFAASLLLLWLGLVCAALAGAGTQIFHASRAGETLAAHLRRDQIHLKMPGRLTIKGCSAGLPFALSVLLSVYRAYPCSVRRSWLWRWIFEKFDSDAHSWAATGVVTIDGHVKPVHVDPKLRACLDRTDVENLLMPRQSDSSQRALDQMARAPQPEISTARKVSLTALPNIGYAAEPRGLRVHRCRDLAGAVLRIGAVTSRWQAAMNLAALAVSGVMLAALPDLRCILFPPPPPVAVAPSSPSPYFLWVSLDTQRPDFFQVVLESKVWVNRRADVAARNSAPASVRAEIRLARVTRVATRDFEDGIVWIERRPCFLTRRYEPGERVGRYTFAYLNRFGHE